jgi:general L-amino acid transport system substrate-binding protein
VDEIRDTTTDLNIQRFLGVEFTTEDGTATVLEPGLGLPTDFAYQVVKQVGNYGEIFERNVGKGSALKIERGLNALWTSGGIQYAPPIR